MSIDKISPVLFPIGKPNTDVCPMPASSAWTTTRAKLLLLQEVALWKWKCRDLRQGGDDTWARPSRGNGGRGAGCNGNADDAAQFHALLTPPGFGRAFLTRGGEVPMLSTRSWFSALRKTHPFPWPGSWLAERINLRQLRVRCHARKSRCSKTHTNLSVHVTSVGFIKSPQEPPTRGWRVGSGSPPVGKFLIHL